MAKEELEKEAEKNILNLKNNAIKVSGKPFQINEGDYIQGYLDGAKPREKQIEKLKQQIEQMKSDVIKHFGEEYNMARLLNEWDKEVEREGCPDVLCEDCTEEDCTVRKLGLVPTKEN